MGHRTVVILNNDLASGWEVDSDLGKKICHGMYGSSPFEYGSVPETIHCDVQTLMIIDGTQAKPVAHSHWHQSQTTEDMKLSLLKEFAEKIGYRVVKKKTVKKVA